MASKQNHNSDQTKTKAQRLKELETLRKRIAELESTQQDWASQNAPESYELYRLLMQHAADAFFVHDHEGKFVDVNQRACESLGYTREELFNLTVYDVEKNLPPEKLQELWKQMIPGLPVTAEGIHQRKDGTRFPVEVRVVLIDLGKVQLMLALARDITDRKLAEASLQASEARYRALVENIPVITYIAALDEISSTLYVSPQIGSMLGFRQDEWVASPDLFVTQLHPDDRDRVLQEVAQSQATGNPFLSEFRMITRDGRTRWFRDEATVLHDQHGQPHFIQGVMLDITDRKQAELSLQQSELRSRAVAQSANDAIISADRHGKIISWNLGAETIFGHKEEEVIGQPLTLIVPERYREDHLRGIARMSSGGKPKIVGKTVQMQGLRKNGSEFPAEISLTVWKVGEESFYSGIIRDVTERRRAEEQVRFQAQLLDSVRESVVATNLNGNVIYWGKGAELLYGYSSDEVMGKPITFIVDSEDEIKERQQIQQVLEKGIWSGQYIQRRKDGTQFSADTIISLVRDQEGNPCGIIGIDRDITERMDTEHALRESEKHSRTIFKSAPIAMTTINIKGQLLGANRSLQVMLGYTEDELLAMTFMDFTHPDDRKASKKLFKGLVKGDYNRFQLEKRFLPKDGSIVWGCTAMSAVRDEQGQFQYGIAQIENITARKNTQEALDQTNMDLSHTLAHLQQLSHHVLQVQENLYRSVSRELHDNIGQLVNAVKMRLERLGRNKALQNTKSLFSPREELQDSVDQLKQVSQEIRRLSKQMRPEVLDELGLIESLISYTRDFQTRTGIKTKLIHHMNDQSLPSDVQTHLYRIVQEALNNITKHARARRAVIRLEKGRNQIVLSIEDNGKGFSLDRVGKRDHHFKGIGLTSMQERAKILKGTAEIQSRPGKGTTISVIVPLSD